MPETPDDLMTGEQWLVDSYECDPAALRSPAALGEVFARAVRDLGLHPLASPAWHVFPGGGGVTGLLMLTESHLSCHTFPERGFAAFDLYSCRPRPCWGWAEHLRDLLGTRRVVIRRVVRGTGDAESGAAPRPGDAG
jgi:S-adenosylmethionine decarboxylase